MKEVFRPVKGFEGFYEISNKGRVKTLYTSSQGKRGGGDFLKERTTRQGYKFYQLNKSGKKSTVLTHRLIAQAFIENPEGKNEINHIDGNKANNNLDNLEWCTRKENIKHAFETGLNVGRKGEKNFLSKLTYEKVKEIKELLTEGNMSAKDIGKKYGVSQSCITNINLGHTWKGVEWPNKKRKHYRFIDKETAIAIKKEVFQSNETIREIAERHGVSSSTVENIKYGITWKRLKQEGEEHERAR